MSEEDYRRRPHDHLVEPMFAALDEEEADLPARVGCGVVMGIVVLLGALLLLFLMLGCSPRPAPLEVPDLPSARHSHRAHFVDGELFIIGGFVSGAAGERHRGSNSVISLDSSTDTWKQRADLIVGKAFASSVVIEDRIYAIGDDIERYDIERDAWEVILEAGRLPRSHFASAAIGNRIYTIGGFPADRELLTVFDVKTGELSALPPLPNFEPGDHFHFVAALDDELHVFGGLDHEHFEPQSSHWKLVGDRWVACAEPPKPVDAKFAAYGVSGGVLYVFGPLAHRYNPHVDVWSEVDEWPHAHPRVLPATFEHHRRLYVLGGFAPEPPRKIDVYDPVTGVWVTDERDP